MKATRLHRGLHEDGEERPVTSHPDADLYGKAATPQSYDAGSDKDVGGKEDKAAMTVYVELLDAAERPRYKISGGDCVVKFLPTEDFAKIEGTARTESFISTRSHSMIRKNKEAKAKDAELLARKLAVEWHKEPDSHGEILYSIDNPNIGIIGNGDAFREWLQKYGPAFKTAIERFLNQ